jgi:hypothetical protein
MEPEQARLPPEAADESPAEAAAPIQHDMEWVLIGPDGLRAGWSILLFAGIAFCFLVVSGGLVTFLLQRMHFQPGSSEYPVGTIGNELTLALGLAGGAAVVLRLEGRPVSGIHLAGPRPALHFLWGLTAGFLAVSVLVGAMAGGGWLQFGPAALTGTGILSFGAAWAVAFLLVACFEEGLFRGYLQATLARGVNFWWALAAVAGLSLRVALSAGASGGAGVWAAALMGLGPCLWLHWKRRTASGFWQAAWITSTAFGFIHTHNSGESAMGIFAAALIGAVFCVSIRVTGSLWWALGCHAAWDWAQTFFYGTADSGLPARGHLFSAAPCGNPLLSGGADGPEASLLAAPAILLLLAALLWFSRKADAPASSTR